MVQVMIANTPISTPELTVLQYASLYSIMAYTYLLHNSMLQLVIYAYLESSPEPREDPVTTQDHIPIIEPVPMDADNMIQVTKKQTFHYNGDRI